MQSINVKNLSKAYKLGETHTGLLSETLGNAISSFARAVFRSGKQSPAKKEQDVFWALKDVSFSVNEGDVVGVVGKNGAGKSTLLKILSRITLPSEGSVDIYGRVASLLEVGTGFHPELTGRENIFLNGAILGMSKAEIRRKFDEIVDFAEVGEFIDTPVKRYSSGMYVRLAFSVAAHLEPEILIVDEVLAVGDAEFQKKCLGKMDGVAKEGRTVLFVSHNMSAVQRLCNRALLLEHGKLSMNDDVKTVVDHYFSQSVVTGDVGDLSEHKREHHKNSTTYFTRCNVLDSHGVISGSLRYGEPISVFLEATTKSRISDISIVVGIDTLYQTRITTVSSDESGIHCTPDANGNMKMWLTFNNVVLTPGHYSLSIALKSGGTVLDLLMYIVYFEVSALTFGTIKPHNNAMGVIKTTATWSTGEIALDRKNPATG